VILAFRGIGYTGTARVVLANRAIGVRNPTLSARSAFDASVGGGVANAGRFRTMRIKKTLYTFTSFGSLATNLILLFFIAMMVKKTINAGLLA